MQDAIRMHNISFSRYHGNSDTNEVSSQFTDGMCEGDEHWLIDCYKATRKQRKSCRSCLYYISTRGARDYVRQKTTLNGAQLNQNRRMVKQGHSVKPRSLGPCHRDTP